MSCCLLLVRAWWLFPIDAKDRGPDGLFERGATVSVAAVPLYRLSIAGIGPTARAFTNSGGVDASGNGTFRRDWFGGPLALDRTPDPGLRIRRFYPLALVDGTVTACMALDLSDDRKLSSLRHAFRGNTARAPHRPSQGTEHAASHQTAGGR